MRVLIVALEDPWQPLGGAALRTRGWSMTARGLDAVTRLRVLSLLAGPDVGASPQSSELGVGGLEIRNAAVGRTIPGRALGRLASALNGLPHHLGVARSRAVRSAFLDMVDEFRPDVIQLEQLAVADLVSALDGSRVSRPKILFSAHNLEHRIVRPGTRPFGSTLDRHQRRQVQRLEEGLLARVDGVVAVSREEASWFRARTEKPVFVVPNAIEIGSTPSLVQETTHLAEEVLLFCGHLSYPPNEGAATFLVEHILPEVQRNVPEARVLLTGRSPGRRVRLLAGPAVEVQANPANNDFFSRSRVLVCPLRHGAGSRIKLLEAAATGLPIVATPFSAKGLALEAGRDFLAGHDSRELARATVRVLRDDALRDALTSSAKATVERYHSWSRLGPSIGSLYETLARGDGQERGA